MKGGGFESAAFRCKIGIMNDVMSRHWLWPFVHWSLELDAPASPAPSSLKHDWPLMGDIVTMRGGIPEHLIQWGRATGENDPAPRL